MIKITRKTLLKTLILLIVLGILVGGVIGIMEYLSWKNVTFTLSPSTKSATVYYSAKDPDHDSDLVKAGAVDTSSTIRLKVGSYVVVPSGDNISDTPIAFEVKGDSTVTVDPYYSEDYLSKAFAGEIEDIDNALHTKYPFTTTSYVVETGRFYHFGDWYATTLYKSSPEPGEGVDIYGVILHKTDGKWAVVDKPDIVFTYTANPSIPTDIVDSANQFLYNL